VVNFNGTVVHPAYNIYVEARLFKKENGYKPWLYKFSFDGCKFLKKNYNPIATLFFNLMEPFSNLNHTCPYMVSSKTQKSSLILSLY